MQYLTERNLQDFLKQLFPESDIVRNKQVPQAGVRFRPDYRIEPDKIIVEFNGFTHYTSVARQLTDLEKLKIYSKLNYKVIEIPYFIQLESRICCTTFGRSCSLANKWEFPQGFVDDEALLPGDFNDLGIRRLLHDLCTFPCVAEEVLSSLDEKVKTLGKIRVIGSSEILNELISTRNFRHLASRYPYIK